MSTIKNKIPIKKKLSNKITAKSNKTNKAKRGVSKQKIEIAIIIPTYNEKENISTLVKELTTKYKSAHVFVVDDNSPDGTAALVERIGKTNKRVHLILRKKKQGIGKAYIHGFKEVLPHKPKYIVQMDADFSHNPDKISEMLMHIKHNDIVLGSRYINGISVINWPLSRVLLSWFANWYVRKVTRMKVMDATGGFKCFRRDALESLFLDKIGSDGYCFQIEMNFLMSRLGYTIKEIPIIFVDRRVGESKMSWNIIVEALTKVLWMPFKQLDRYGSFKKTNG